MSSIIDVLDKQLNCIQRDKINEMQSIVNRLKSELKYVNSLAEQRKQTIEALESEKKRLLKESMNSLRTKIKEILGMPLKVVANDEEILSEIREYKGSTEFWRQKYHLLCSDMESIAEKLEIEELGQQTDRTDVSHVLLKIQSFVKQIDSLKNHNFRLCRQIEDKEKYCQTLIDLRNKLNLEIDSLKQQKFEVIRERDSLNDKCFWQNSVINAFQLNQTIHSKAFKQNNGSNVSNRPLKAKVSRVFTAMTVTEDTKTTIETSTQSHRSDGSDFDTPEEKKIKYWLRSESKSALSAKSDSPSGQSLSTNELMPNEEKSAKELKVMSCRKLFITNV